MGWQIKGESGATLDDTLRTFEEIGAEGWELTFQSLAEDTLTWSAATADATGTGTIIPDAGQIIEVFHDSVRRFRGHVAMPRVGLKSVVVQVYGPWWWMDRIALTSTVADATGATGERAQFVFPTQDIKTSIETLIDRMIAQDVPIIRGTVDAMFSVPKISLSDTSFAAALTELLRWVPDQVAWFDYTGTTGTDPILNISRRGAMTAETLTVGTDPIETADLVPRLDLEVARAEINYVTRQASTGKPQWAAQTAGTTAAGKRQIITVSGPEIVDFLPLDDFASGTIQTTQLAASGAMAQIYDPVIADAVAGYGSIPWATGADYGIFPSSPRLTSGSGFLVSGKYRITAGTLTDWMKEDHSITVSRYRVSGWLYNQYPASPGHGAAVTYLKTIGRAYSGYHAGSATYTFIVFVDYEVEVIDVSYPSLTTLYKAWDYDYLTPPAGLATNLQAAQNWVPWEGRIQLVGDDVDGQNLLAKKFHLAGAYSACASMGALAKSIAYDGTRKRTTITLGSPARSDFGTLVSRIRRNPQDNIVYL